MRTGLLANLDGLLIRLTYMLPHSVDCVPAETMKKLIDRVWRRHYETVLTRVDLLERTATAIIQESLTPPLLDEALSACHKLAGALGSFGYMKERSWPES